MPLPSPPLFERLSILGLNNLLAVTLLAPKLPKSDDHKNTLGMTMVFVWRHEQLTRSSWKKSRCLSSSLKRLPSPYKDPSRLINSLIKSPSVPNRPVFPNFKNANFWGENLREGGIWPSSYLGEWQSGTAIPVSNRPFGPKLWKAEERASKPFLYQPTAPPNWCQISRKNVEPRLVHLIFLPGVFVGSGVFIAFQKWRRKEAIICAFPMVKERVLGN